MYNINNFNFFIDLILGVNYCSFWSDTANSIWNTAFWVADQMVGKVLGPRCITVDSWVLQKSAEISLKPVGWCINV